MDQGAGYSEQEARDKNIEEYNKVADCYDRWCAENVLM